MRFGMVDRMGPGMGQVVGFGVRSMGRDNFGGECGAPHCNQWGTFMLTPLWRTCAKVREPSEPRFRVVRGVD